MAVDDESVPSSHQPLLPNLPDDISVQCIARLPLSSHPSLSLVSRSWRSLLRSPSLSAVRSKLSVTEPLLTLSIRTLEGESRWYYLHPSSSSGHGHRIVSLPSPPLPAVGSACAPIGPHLFLLGGSIAGKSSTSVQNLDFLRRRWSLGPSMSSAREFAAAGTLDDRIYAVGGCLPSSASWAESLVPPAGRWEAVPLPPDHLREKWMHGSAVLGRKLLAVADRGGVVFDQETSTWALVPGPLDLGWRGRAAVVGNVLYTYDYLGKIRGYDWDAEEWRQVEGLDRVLPKFLCGATLAGLRGLLCLVWEGKGRGRGGELEISCAGIGISRTEGGGMRGKIVWLEPALLKVPRGSSVAHCVALEL